MKQTLKRLAPSFLLDAIVELRRLGFAVKRLFYLFIFRGNTYYCPICHYSGSRFMPDGLNYPVLEELCVVGAGRRYNSRCPRCCSKERERLLWIYLGEKFKRESLHLLHFAPEEALKRRFGAMKQLQYTNADLNPRHADAVMDITSIPLDDKSVDIIVCNHVLEHVANDALAMRELFRVLKPGGEAILQVPLSEVLNETIEDGTVSSFEERARRFGQGDHVRLYGRDYYTRLRRAGFDVCIYCPSEFMAPQEVKRMALNDNERLIVCKRQDLARPNTEPN